ncbi:MAG: tRNA 4-thiouridine(8) synthase ThiI, partial [Thermoprotei archaeon]
EAIALRIGAEGIVTGESLGQVASQTLRNLYVSSLAVSMPIYRPLIGMDKDDIVKMAKEIGTYDLSALVKEYCGSFAEHPRTHANVEEVEREEAKIDRSILTEILRGVREIDLKSLTAPKTYRELEISEIPSDAVVIDLRAPSKFKAWHLEGALNIDFLALPSELPRLNKNKKYVLVCDEGALSLEAARIMREAGFEAYSYKGGVRRLKRKSS